MVSSSRAHNGCIQMHQWHINDVPTLSDTSMVSDVHQEQAWTIDKEEKIINRLRREYMNQIKHIYELLQKTYPYYYEVRIQVIT